MSLANMVDNGLIRNPLQAKRNYGQSKIRQRDAEYPLAGQINFINSGLKQKEPRTIKLRSGFPNTFKTGTVSAPSDVRPDPGQCLP